MSNDIYNPFQKKLVKELHDIAISLRKISGRENPEKVLKSYLEKGQKDESIKED